MASNLKPVCVLLDEYTHEELKRRAKRSGVSLSSYLRLVVRGVVSMKVEGVFIGEADDKHREVSKPTT